MSSGLLVIFKIYFTENEKRYYFGEGFRHDDLIRSMSTNGRYGVGCMLDVNLLFKILRDQKQKMERGEKDFSVFFEDLSFDINLFWQELQRCHF